MMEGVKARILESIQQIFNLYETDVNVDETIKLMRDRNISANVVKGIYDQLSEDAKRLMTERFYYYTLEEDLDKDLKRIRWWTSRYLLGYSKSRDSAFHDITVFDVFNNKSM
jgi:hypothetical protein